MKILYITVSDPAFQGDYQENTILHGLRSILGNSVIDYPRKKIMYGDFSDTPRDSMHGLGFSLVTKPIEDIDDRDIENVDCIIYGVTDAYGVFDYPEINCKTKNIFYIDGYDDCIIRKKPCFKRELFQEEDNVSPTGFGIPHYQIRPINLNNKKQIIQKTAPKHSLFYLILGANNIIYLIMNKIITMICPVRFSV